MCRNKHDSSSSQSCGVGSNCDIHLRFKEGSVAHHFFTKTLFHLTQFWSVVRWGSYSIIVQDRLMHHQNVPTRRDATPYFSFVTPHIPKLAITSKWHNEDIKMVISLVWQSKTCEVRSETSSRECDDFRSHGFPFYQRCLRKARKGLPLIRLLLLVGLFGFFFLLFWVPERNRCSLINQKRGRSVSNGEYGCMFINCIHANSLCSRIYYWACFLTTFQGCNFTGEREILVRKLFYFESRRWRGSRSSYGNLQIQFGEG